MLMSLDPCCHATDGYNSASQGIYVGREACRIIQSGNMIGSLWHRHGKSIDSATPEYLSMRISECSHACFIVIASHNEVNLEHRQNIHI